MKRKRFSEEQIIGILKQAEGGLPLPELIRDMNKTSNNSAARSLLSSLAASGGPDALTRVRGNPYAQEDQLVCADLSPASEHRNEPSPRLVSPASNFNLLASRPPARPGRWA